MDFRELRSSLRAMADLGRLRILQYLARYDETTVSSLTRGLRMSQPLASWHLRTLRRAGLIVTRRVGREVHCSLNRSRIEECRQALAELMLPAQSGAAHGSPDLPR